MLALGEHGALVALDIFESQPEELGDLLRGDFGQSARSGIDVVQLIAQAVPSTLWLIGLAVLDEARNAPFGAYIGFMIAGAIATFGVYQLARHHPQIVSDSQELPIVRGSGTAADATDAPVDESSPKTGAIRITEAVSKVWPNPPVDDDHEIGPHLGPRRSKR